MWCTGLSDICLISVPRLLPVGMLAAVRQVVEVKVEKHKVKPAFSQIIFHFNFIQISDGR